ncbi:hypothetical protein GQ53DRAFT_862592 [Thozetella sp. PMI_491]|nr:hypothetical protein GQ53DRAFT_862592 [Thozetella sp. PMI_491]
MKSAKRITLGLAALSYLPHQSIAYDPTLRKCEYICLTSMRWCSSNGQSDKDQTGCTFPPNTYPYYDRDSGENPAMLVASRDYEITWKMADGNYPVRITWSYGDNPRTHWETTVNASSSTGSFTFNPGKIFDTYPNEYNRNISGDAARSMATGVGNLIQISQPDKPAPPGEKYNDYVDVSSQFSVQSPYAVNYIEAAASAAAGDVEAKWKKGVGIGVGVGVPVLLAATALVVWFLAKRHFRSSARHTVSKSSVAS